MIDASKSVGGESKISDSKLTLEVGWSTQFGTVDEEIETNEIVNTILDEMGRGSEKRVDYGFYISYTDKNDPEGAVTSWGRTAYVLIKPPEKEE